MAIYTKTGDKGVTSLASGERVQKTDARVEAYGTVDELNSSLGWLRAGMRSDEALLTADAQLLWIQNRLFDLGAALSEAPGTWVTDTDAQQLEAWIDAMQAELPKQRVFLLPAGSECVCRCHICRTICRRAERRILEVSPSDGTHTEALKFMNRLSDYLFVLSRYVTHLQKGGEEAWEPKKQDKKE